MRYVLFILLLGSLAACEFFPAPLTQTQEFEPHPRWSIEQFKTEFDIQFPDDYTGGYSESDWGNGFKKFREDSLVTVWYSFCGFAGCADYFGTETIDDDMKAITLDSEVVDVDNQITFSLGNDEEYGYLFYNEEEQATGVFIMKVGGEYRRFAYVDFASKDLREVVNILRTVQPR